MSISIILAIVGLVASVLGYFIPQISGILGFVSLILWIVGIVIGVKDAKKGNKSGTAGAVLCGILLGLSVVAFIILMVFAGALIGVAASGAL